MIAEGDRVEWCGGHLAHEHACGSHDAACDLATDPPVCSCGRCGFERGQGVVQGLFTIPKMEPEDDVPGVSVLPDDGLPVSMPLAMVSAAPGGRG